MKSENGRSTENIFDRIYWINWIREKTALLKKK